MKLKKQIEIVVAVICVIYFCIFALIDISDKSKIKRPSEKDFENLIELEEELYFLSHDKAVQETIVEDVLEQIQNDKEKAEKND